MYVRSGSMSLGVWLRSVVLPWCLLIFIHGSKPLESLISWVFLDHPRSMFSPKAKMFLACQSDWNCLRYSKGPPRILLICEV